MTSMDSPSRRLPLVLIAALALAGCSSVPNPFATPTESSDVNAVPQNYKSELLAFMQTYLNDPTDVREAQIADPVLKRVGSSDRYVVCLKYNAKDSQGRYMGAKDSVAVFLRGRFNQLVSATGEICKGAVYQPFPELEVMRR
jgi:hypothetical protein